MKPTLNAALLACLFALPISAHARFVQPPPCKNAFSPEQEIAEGRKAAVQVYKTTPVLPESSPVTRYIQQLGARLAAVAPGSQWPYVFHVVNQSEINAFALPGGPVFINLGTIQAADTEAQLAGVMAHEISHVVMRHATCNITRQQGQAPWWALGQVAAGIFLPGAGGALVAQGVGAAAGMTFLKMGRDAERQADLMGVDILSEAGYDPRGLPQFFEIIQGKYGSGGSQFLSDHPNPGNRTEYVNAEIATLPSGTRGVKTTAEFTKMKKIATELRAYSSKEVASGVWKKDGANAVPVAITEKPVDFTPGATWTELGHSRFSLQYPANWRVSQRVDGVAIAPDNGLATATDGSEAVIYGVIVDAFHPQPDANLDAATSQLIAGLQQGNAGLKTVTQVEEIRVNQQQGESVEFLNGGVNQESSASGATERDWLVTIARGDGSLNYLVFVAPQKDFEALRPTFERILRTFRVK